jgi:hypothetical protein
VETKLIPLLEALSLRFHPGGYSDYFYGYLSGNEVEFFKTALFMGSSSFRDLTFLSTYLAPFFKSSPKVGLARFCTPTAIYIACCCFKG